MKIKSYLQYANWYEDANKMLMRRVSDQLYIKILCATSPRKSLKANIKLADSIYHNYLMDEDPFKNVSGLMPSHKPNVLRALNGEDLQGDKVSRFFKNLILDLEVVTIDVWVKRYFKLKDTLTPLQYQKVEDRIRRNAKRYGLKPAQYQAVIWIIARERYGFKPLNYTDVMG